ncbi:MFS general substrate transporter [Xylariaceae sp. FL0016]|nr:MFS general substrate transporter [Xylariaceae sp. FL0016]
MTGRMRTELRKRTTLPPTKEDNLEQVVGSTELYDSDGRLCYIPTPTADPKDPLNMTQGRKWIAVAALCAFGALALSSEAIIAALIPVFVLEYAGYDPRILGTLDIKSFLPPQEPGQPTPDALEYLSEVGGPPLWQVSLLSSLPLLVNGVASWVLVPLSVAVGRRPVLLFAGCMAWTGGLWAGFSRSLGSHLAARCFMGLGAGVVEALIPLVVQDFMFIHERNRAIAAIHATQGVVMVTLGVASPYIVVRVGWRAVYYITAGAALCSWAAIFFVVPETRWLRSMAELGVFLPVFAWTLVLRIHSCTCVFSPDHQLTVSLAGKGTTPLDPDTNRPVLDPTRFGTRTLRTDLDILTTNPEWREAGTSVLRTLQATLFPNVIWATCTSAVFVGAHGAATQTASSVLIVAGWDFQRLGLAVVPLVVAAPCVMLFGGVLADRISNYVAKRSGGRREPEAALWSMLVPIVAGVAGPLVFGYTAQNIDTLPTWVIFIGVFLLGFGGMTIQTLIAVYLVECYPLFAGPVLVTVSSMRLVLGFALNFRATSWVKNIGFFQAFSIYSGCFVGVAIFMPLIFIYGRRIRHWATVRLGAAGPGERVKSRDKGLEGDGKRRLLGEDRDPGDAESLMMVPSQGDREEHAYGIEMDIMDTQHPSGIA